MNTAAPTGFARIAARFAALAAEGRAGLVTYVMGGDPDIAHSGKILAAIAEAGADFIELGFPFTDPMADGPAIQAAGQRALAAGAGLAGILGLARQFRTQFPDIPLILMGYLNPVLAMGPARFARSAREAGVDGAILVDLPPEEDHEIREVLASEGIALIRLATPTTDASRLPIVLEGAAGFLYYVSLTGVTGQKSADAGDVAGALAALRQVAKLPIAVGFGVRTPEMAAAIARIADAVVVGSAIVEQIGVAADLGQPGEAPARAAALVAELAAAVRNARL